MVDTPPLAPLLAEVDARNGDGYTALHLAALALKPALVTALLQGGIFGLAAQFPGVYTQAVMGGQGMAVTIGNMMINSLINIFSLLVLLVFRIVARRNWLAIILYVAVFTQINTTTNDGAMTFVFVILLHLTNVLVALRFGLLAVMTAHFVQELLVKFPITSGLSEWYAASGLVGLGSALG